MRKSWFVKNRADRKRRHHKTYSNRRGTFSSRGNGKGVMRSQGSSKPGFSCSAYIKARINAATGEVTADYCLQHVGYKQETVYSQISANMYSGIAGKLARVTMNYLDFIRSTQVGPPIRYHLTTHKDLNKGFTANKNLVNMSFT